MLEKLKILFFNTMKLKNTEIIYSLKVWLTSTAIPTFIFLCLGIYSQTSFNFSEIIPGILFTVLVGLVISMPYLPVFYLIVNQTKKLISNLIIRKIVICIVHVLIILGIFFITWGDLFYKDKALIFVYLFSGGFSTLIWKLENTNLPILTFKRIIEFLNNL